MAVTHHHAKTGNALDVIGWEKWKREANLMIVSALRWFDGNTEDQHVNGI
ncbi:MAG: hypothetical protein AAGF27_01435 [Pseudomonadota bacterium]